VQIGNQLLRNNLQILTGSEKPARAAAICPACSFFDFNFRNIFVT